MTGARLKQETHKGQYVPVVINTHQARERSKRVSLDAIDALPTIQWPSVCLRIINQPRESARLDGTSGQIFRESYAQCSNACRCCRRHSRSPRRQFCVTCPTCRRMARHRLIWRSSSGHRRPR